MSVINQVLNQLEQRGEHNAADETMVRAVVRAKRDFTLPLLAAGFALVAGIAAWQWVLSRKQDVMVDITATKQSVAAHAATPSDVSAEVVAAESQLPASRMSFELSSVPLPSTLRQGSGQAPTSSGATIPESNRPPKAEPVKGAAISATRQQPKQQLNPKSAENSKPVDQTSSSSIPMKVVSAAQQADAEYRRAAGLMKQGHIDGAIAGYEEALRLDADHDAARQSLVAALLEEKRNADAEKVLMQGLKRKPDHTVITMLLARLQVERGAIEQATATLEKTLPFADTQPDYRAFLAALLQRQSRNEEAIKQYQIVLQQAPGNGVWLMGYGISLQAVQRNAEARIAYQQALDSQSLSPELRAFVQQKLKAL